MRPPVPALLLSLCLPASALERVVEAPLTAVPQMRLTGVPELNMPLVNSLSGGPSALLVPGINAAAKLPAASGAQGRAAVPQIPVLPAAVVPSGGKAAVAAAAGEEKPFFPLLEGGGDGLEAGTGELFDGSGKKRSPLSEQLARHDAGALNAYRRALDDSRRSDWFDRGAAAADAGLALWAKQGVKAARTAVTIGKEEHPAVVVSPEKGVSALNDLAYELDRSMGVALAYVPLEERNTLGAYSSVNKLIVLGEIGGRHVYAVALHEARHAWYSRLLERLQIRLFHMSVKARPGLDVRAGAMTYNDALSMEELSTFPKTLKHLLTEHARSGAGDAAELERTMTTRVRQLADMLKTAEDIAGRIRSLQGNGRLEPELLSSQEADEHYLQAVDGIAWYRLPLARTRVYVPVPVRETKILGFKRLASSKKEARAALLARADALTGLVEAMVPAVVAYYEAVDKKDWAAASRAADGMIAAVAAAEAAWAKSSPHGEGPGKSGS